MFTWTVYYIVKSPFGSLRREFRARAWGREGAKNKWKESQRAGATPFGIIDGTHRGWK